MSAAADVSRRELVSVDPATLSEVGRVAVTAPEELAEVVAEARMAQQAFAREPLERRRQLLERVSHVLVEEADAIARTVVAESGKPLAEAYAHDLVVAADACRWHAANVERVLGEERLEFPQLVLRQKRGWLRYEPLGVVALVTPWRSRLGDMNGTHLKCASAGQQTGSTVTRAQALTSYPGAWNYVAWLSAPC